MGTEKVHGRLSIVALACLVYLGLRQYNEAGPIVVPLELHLITFEEVLLRGRGVKFGHIVDADGRR